MTDFLLNECGDLDYTDGRLTLVTGVDAIRQRWLIYIRTFLGEWFLDQSIGVPYYQRVLKKAVSRQTLKQVFKDATLEVPGVLQVVSVVVDSLNVATREAEVTVTCVVTGDEGPETGVFRFTGVIPPKGCGVVTDLPQEVAAAFQWYWFDPSDLSEVEASPAGGPYVAGAQFELQNKFIGQAGTATCDGTGFTVPRILPVLNGRKAIELDESTDFLACGFGFAGEQVRSLRGTTGWDFDAPTQGDGFTVFGVYQAVDNPSLGFDPLMTFNGVDTDGTTRRWLNIRIGSDIQGDLVLRVEQDTVAGAPSSVDAEASGVVPTDPFAFALRYSFGVTVVFIEVWVNGSQILDTSIATSDVLLQTGEVAWSGSQNDGGSLEFNGSMLAGEQLGYSRQLDDQEIANVFAYLTPKWGL